MPGELVDIGDATTLGSVARRVVSHVEQRLFDTSVDPTDILRNARRELQARLMTRQRGRRRRVRLACTTTKRQ